MRTCPGRHCVVVGHVVLLLSGRLGLLLWSKMEPCIWILQCGFEDVSSVVHVDVSAPTCVPVEGVVCARVLECNRVPRAMLRQTRGTGVCSGGGIVLLWGALSFYFVR